MNYDYKSLNNNITDSLKVLKDYVNTCTENKTAACCAFDITHHRFIKSFGQIWVGQAKEQSGGNMGKYRNFLHEYCKQKGLLGGNYNNCPSVQLLDELTLFSDWDGGNLVVMKISEKPSAIGLLTIQYFLRHVNTISSTPSIITIVWPGGTYRMN